MNEIKDKLNSMSHRHFVYRNEVVEVLGHVLYTGDNEDEYEIMLSNGRTITGYMRNLASKLEEFVNADRTIATVVDYRINQVSSFNADTMSALRDAVLDCIRAVREDPKAVAQAKQVFQGVNTLVNLAKTELDFRKYIDKQNKTTR